MCTAYTYELPVNLQVGPKQLEIIPHAFVGRHGTLIRKCERRFRSVRVLVEMLGNDEKMAPESVHTGQQTPL